MSLIASATARMGHIDVRPTLGLHAQASDDLDAAAAEAIAGYLARDGRAMEGDGGASTGRPQPSDPLPHLGSGSSPRGESNS